MKKVLVVDDSKTIRTICEWIYKGLEDHLLTADSAEAARQVIASESPDVVIVDYTLPDMDAYDFVLSIKERARVIMLGGQFAPFSEDKAMASGALAIIRKPFRCSEFFDAVEVAMNADLSPAESVDIPTETPTVVNETLVNEVVVEDSLVVEDVSVDKEDNLSNKDELEPVQTEPFQNTTTSPYMAPVSAAVPPIGGFVAPSQNKASSQDMPVAPAAAPISPFAGAKRFNFPSQSTASQTQSEQPASSQAPVPNSGVSPIVPPPISSVSPAVQAPAASFGTTRTHNSAIIQPAAMTPVAEHATPKSPVSAVSGLQVVPPQPQAQEQQLQIDPAVLRAEVISAVKSLLPAIVNSYLKKLIQAEVKPQLQNWVDTRVEALIKKMMQQ